MKEEKLTHWNYRVIRKVFELNGEIEEQFGIHEVYYSDGKPSICSVEPDRVSGDSLEWLKQSLIDRLDALKKPVIDYKDITGRDN